MDYRTIIIKRFEELSEMNIVFPEIQRIVDKDNVNDIIRYQLDFMKLKKRFNFLGVINIHYVKEFDT